MIWAIGIRSFQVCVVRGSNFKAKEKNLFQNIFQDIYIILVPGATYKYSFAASKMNDSRTKARVKVVRGEQRNVYILRLFKKSSVAIWPGAGHRSITDDFLLDAFKYQLDLYANHRKTVLREA